MNMYMKIKVLNEKRSCMYVNQENIKSFCLWFLVPVGFYPFDGFE